MKCSIPAFTVAPLTALMAASFAALLTGCGGGGADSTSIAAPEPAPAMTAAADAFTASMVVLVRSAPDTTEPDDVEGAALAKPDDREPVAVE